MTMVKTQNVDNTKGSLSPTGNAETKSLGRKLSSFFQNYDLAVTLLIMYSKELKTYVHRC
jgi:hypothetical protein